MSTRSTNASNATEFAKPATIGLCFVWLDWTTGVVAAHDGVGTFTFGGVDYLGVGNLGKVELIRDSIGRSPSIDLTISGVNPALIEGAQLREQYGRAAKIYVGAVNADMQLVADPELQFSGFMTRTTAKLGDKTAEISVRLVSNAQLLHRTTAARVTAEDQKARFPDDTFFDFLPLLPSRQVVWGGKQFSSGGPGHGGRPSPGRPVIP